MSRRNGTEEEDDLELPPAYLKIRMLGQGSFGRVYLVENLDTRTEAALKIFKEERYWIKEVRGYELVRGLCGKGVVCEQARGRFADYYWLAIDYIPGTRDGGEFLTNPEAMADLSEDPEALRAIFLKMCAQLVVLADARPGGVHTPGVALRDIKPANVLLDLQRREGWFIDLGFACVAAECEGVTGTLHYMSPEILQVNRALVFPESRDPSALAEMWLGNDAWCLALTFADFLTALVTMGRVRRFVRMVNSAAKKAPDAEMEPTVLSLAVDGDAVEVLKPWEMAFEMMRVVLQRRPAVLDLVEMLRRILLVRASEPEYRGWERLARQRSRTDLVRSFAKRNPNKLFPLSSSLLPPAPLKTRASSPPSSPRSGKRSGNNHTALTPAGTEATRNGTPPISVVSKRSKLSAVSSHRRSRPSIEKGIASPSPTRTIVLPPAKKPRLSPTRGSPPRKPPARKLDFEREPSAYAFLHRTELVQKVLAAKENNPAPLERFSRTTIHRMKRAALLRLLLQHPE